MEKTNSYTGECSGKKSSPFPFLILASKSPRRQELMKRITDNFITVPSGVNEETVKEDDPVRFAVSAAVLKAHDVGQRYTSDIIIGADTVVALDKMLIGKPRDYEDARRILEMLSGTRHRVITGIAVYKKNEDKTVTGYEITSVQFKKLQDQDIRGYLAKSEYMDKAGAYAIQSVGDKFVESLKGDYDNVVGFPVKRVKKVLERFLLPEVDVDAVDIAFPEKWAVGKNEGKVIFVPDAVYGDRVKVRLSKRKKSFSYGEVVKIIKPSPFRIEPECPYFGACGGCSFQNLQYKKQTELKERYFLTTMHRMGKIDIKKVEMHPIIPSPDIFYYRNKMEFAFGTDAGKVSLGLRERSSPLISYRRTNVSLKECLIFSPTVKKVFPVFLKFAEGTGQDSYDLLSQKGFFRHLVLREGKNTGELMAILVTRSGGIPDMTGLAESLSGIVNSMWWVENNRVSDVVSFEKKHHIYGSPSIKEKMDNLSFRIYPQSFFQPNTRATRLLYARIKENVQALSENKKILGLYCGPGAIEMFLSDSAAEIIGIDSEHSNISNAEENCKLNGITNCHFYRGQVEDILKGDIHIIKDVDVVIVDPPRAGMSGRALKNVLKINAPALIYVSCNPSALARDTEKLKEGGYGLKKLYCFDFFPHTTHMEGMGIFLKR